MGDRGQTPGRAPDWGIAGGDAEGEWGKRSRENQYKKVACPDGKATSLKNLGVTHKESPPWQKVAKIPEP